jgi:hypothetical protein
MSERTKVPYVEIASNPVITESDILRGPVEAMRRDLGQIHIKKLSSRNGRIVQEPGIYIGRRFMNFDDSVLANPYPVNKHGRHEAVQLYGLWLADKVRCKSPLVLTALGEIRDKVQAGEDVTLLCWCTDHQECHGTVIREAVLTWEF